MRGEAERGFNLLINRAKELILMKPSLLEPRSWVGGYARDNNLYDLHYLFIFFFSSSFCFSPSYLLISCLVFFAFVIITNFRKPLKT